MSVIIMILLLSFLILVHEAGHFLAARALGMRVSKFALGFPIGPTLWSKKIGDVEYLIHACLIGGYVAFPDDDKDSDLPADSPERFQNRPVWQRMIVISAGVFTNLVVAFLLVFMTAGIWGYLPSGKVDVFVNKIVAKKSASVWQSGMQNGDKILRINGSDVKVSNAITMYAQNSASYDGKVDKEFQLENLSKLETLNPKVNAEGVIKEGTVINLPEGITEPALKLDDDVLIGLAFYKDKQIKLDDKQIKLRDDIRGKKTYVADGQTTLSDISFAVSDNLRPLDIVVLREGKEIQLKTIYPNEQGLIGIMPENKSVLVSTKTPASIVKYGTQYLWAQTTMQIYGMYQLFTGKIPAKEMHGIVAVAKLGGDMIDRGGMFSGLLLTAMISAWLVILNFLPIPALDGGHFMFLIIEKLRGKPVSEKTVEILGSIFFTIILILAFLLIGNDIYALLTHKL